MSSWRAKARSGVVFYFYWLIYLTRCSSNMLAFILFYFVVDELDNSHTDNLPLLSSDLRLPAGCGFP